MENVGLDSEAVLLLWFVIIVMIVQCAYEEGFELIIAKEILKLF